MKSLTALVHKGEPHEGGFWATCLEVPGANGQGETREECLQDLRQAVTVMLELNREQVLADDPNTQEMALAMA